MKRSVAKLVAMASGQTLQLVSESSDRWGLVFFPMPTDFQLAPGEMVPTATVGWTVDNQSSPFFLRADLHGDIVKKRWSCRNVTAGSMLIVEVFE